MVITKRSNGMERFKLRINDRCGKYECKRNKLSAYGIAEEEDNKYKVITVCDKCGTFYSFFRINKRMM